MPLILDLLRHGRAEPDSPHGDGGRSLTPEGERSIRRLAERLAREGWRPDRALSSPLKRARDTARAVVGGAGVDVPVEELSELGEADPAPLLAALAARRIGAGHLLLVGHQPQLGLLAHYLTGAERGLAPGALLRIECPSGPARGACRIVVGLDPEDGPGRR